VDSALIVVTRIQQRKASPCCGARAACDAERRSRSHPVCPAAHQGCHREVAQGVV